MVDMTKAKTNQFNICPLLLWRRPVALTETQTALKNVEV